MFEQQIWGYNTGYLHIKQDRCLGDNSSLLGLLLMVSLQPLLGDSLLLLRLLFVTENKSRKKSIAIFRANRPGSKEVDIIVVISCGRSSSATKGKSGAGLGELLHSGAEGLDVIVPEAECNDLPVLSTFAL